MSKKTESNTARTLRSEIENVKGLIDSHKASASSHEAQLRDLCGALARELAKPFSIGCYVVFSGHNGAPRVGYIKDIELRDYFQDGPSAVALVMELGIYARDSGTRHVVADPDHLELLDSTSTRRVIGREEA